MRLLSPACELINVAGSIRRQADVVRDIDLVIFPIVEQIGQPSLFEDASRLTMYPRLLFGILETHNWGDYKCGRYPRAIQFEYRGVPVDLYLAEPDGKNYYSLLLRCTGPNEHNINLAQHARKRDLLYRAGFGVWRGAERIDNGTEEGVYRALGMDWIDPPSRRV